MAQSRDGSSNEDTIMPPPNPSHLYKFVLYHLCFDNLKYQLYGQ